MPASPPTAEDHDNSALRLRPFSLPGLGKSTVGYALGNGVARLAGLLVIPIYTAYLTPDEYGAVATLQLVAALLSPVVTLGIGVSIGICYFERARDQDRSRVVWTAVSLIGPVAAGLLLASIVLAPAVSQWLFETRDLSWPVLAAVLIVAGGGLVQPLALAIQFRQDVLRYVTISTLSAFLGAGVGVALVVSFDRGVAGVLEGQLAAQCLALLAYLLRGARPRPFGLDRSGAIQLVRHGLPLVPSFFFLLLIQQGNQFLVKHFHGLAELGTYAVAYNLGLILGLFVAGFSSAWTPYFLSFSARQDAARIEVGRAAGLYVIAFGTVTLAFFACARPLSWALVAPDFPISVAVLGLSAIAQYLVGLFSVLLPPLYYAKHVSFVTVIQGTGAAIALVANWILVKEFGALGAGIGLVLGLGVTCLLLWAWVRARPGRYLQVSYDWARIGAYWVGFVVLASLFALPRDFTRATELALSGIGILASFVLAVVALPRTERANTLKLLRAHRP